MPQTFLPRSLRGQLVLAGILLVAVGGLVPARAEDAGRALVGVALAIWVGLLAEWVWRRSARQPIAVRRLAAYPIALLAIIFVLVSLGFAGQSVGLLPAPSATPSVFVLAR